MSVSSLSKVQPDLLMADSSNQVSHLLPFDDMKSVSQAVAVYRKDLQAPKHLVTNSNDHELLSKHSRMRRTVADVIDGCRAIGGNAYAEHFLRELKGASQINRGPQGISPGSHLHWDLLLGKDETIEPCTSIIFRRDRKTMQTGGPSRSVMMGQSQGTYMGVPNVASQHGSAYQQTISMLHQSFKNPNWPPNFITPDNVLDYFCDPGNVFYDVSSCNQHIRMQNLNRPLHECLQSMQGIQYTVVGTFPPLYVIMKQRRNSPTNVTPLAYYYIVNGTVYQCPDIYTYIQSKLISIVDPLRQALEQARNFNRFNIAKGYYWEFKDSDSETTKKAVEEKPQLVRSTFYQRTRTDQILRELFAKFPPPDDVQFNFGGNEISGESETIATSDIVEKSVHGSSVNNQDLTVAEDPATGINQQSAFISPPNVHVIPANRSTGESSSGPLNFPETAPVLGTASTDSQHEIDAKRFRGN